MKTCSHRPPESTWNRPGFTMVELLVTITIIIVLASISSFAMSKWNKRAKSVASISKVRDLGVSVLSYMTDKGELPVWHDYNMGMYWWQILAESEGTTDPLRFKSPGDPKFDAKNPAQTLSYGWNYPVIGRHKGDSGYRGDHVMRLTNFPDPGETLILADGPATNCWGYIDPYVNKPDPKRFDGKVAAVFLDGSARMLKSPDDFTETSKYFKAIRPLIPR